MSFEVERGTTITLSSPRDLSMVTYYNSKGQTSSDGHPQWHPELIRCCYELC
jgi:hypothetical protein